MTRWILGRSRLQEEPWRGPCVPCGRRYPWCVGKPCTHGGRGALWFSVRLTRSRVPLHPAETRLRLLPRSGLWARGYGLLLCTWPGLVLGWALKLVSCSLLSPKSPWSSAYLAAQPELYYLQTNTKFLSPPPLCRLPQSREESGFLKWEKRLLS